MRTNPHPANAEKSPLPTEEQPEFRRLRTGAEMRAGEARRSRAYRARKKTRIAAALAAFDARIAEEGCSHAA